MIGRLSLRTRLTLLFTVVPLLCGVLVLLLVLTSARSALFADVTDNTTDLVALKQRGRAAYEQARAAQRDHAERQLALEAGLALLGVSVFSAALGAIVSSRLLLRVQRVTALAQASSDADLSRRANLTGPRDEIRKLGDTFDAMLARLDESFSAQRRFVANAGHELRTPLALTRTAVEVTLARPHATDQQLRTMGEDVLAAINRSQQLVESLLTLARSEQPTVHEHDDLAEHAREAIDQLATDARARRLVLRTELEPAPAVGDHALLARAVANLLENAVRHNNDGGEIAVRTGRNGHVSWIEIFNTGPDLTDTDVEQLLEPFQRRPGGARGNGTGLGLSVVAAVARAHAGSISLRARPARDGGGLTARLELSSRRSATSST